MSWKNFAFEKYVYNYSMERYQVLHKLWQNNYWKLLKVAWSFSRSFST